jgi:hypothetical protein
MGKVMRLVAKLKGKCLGVTCHVPAKLASNDGFDGVAYLWLYVYIALVGFADLDSGFVGTRFAP